MGVIGSVVKDKFLVDLLNSLSHKQWFFLIWLGVVSIFVYLIMAYFKRYTRRNFRAPEDGPAPRFDIYSKRLQGGKGTAMTTSSERERVRKD